MAVTIKDIAIRTGLAISTISKYLNGGNVLPENQVKIKKTIEELGFSANSFARGLKTNKSYRIGIVLESLDDAMQAAVVSRVEAILRRHGYGTLVADCGHDMATQGAAVEFLLSANVDGLLLIPMEADPRRLEAFQKNPVPFIAVLGKPETLDADCVLMDNYSAVYSAMRYVISHHHQQIGLIGGVENDPAARERLSGYAAALKNARIPLEDKYVSFGECTAQSGYERTKTMLQQPSPPTAILAADYRITVGMLLAVKELGLAVPEKIALVGFGNAELAQTLEPKVCVMLNPLDKLASTAVSLLMERLSEEELSPVTQTLKLPTEFFIGESV